MTHYEFNKKWAGRIVDDMSEEELIDFKNDCFEVFETDGFSETFHSPYDDSTYNHNGKPFKVLRRATVGEVEIEVMPVWVVEFEGEPEPFWCYPEEICEIDD